MDLIWHNLTAFGWQLQPEALSDLWLKLRIGEHLGELLFVQGDQSAPLAAYKRGMRDQALEDVAVRELARLLVDTHILRTHKEARAPV
jgi:hypothetical protein